MLRNLFIATFGFTFLCIQTQFAQAPQGISYQSIVRNTGGTPQVSTPVSLRFSILQGSAMGTSVYVETKTLTTNTQGLVTATIGQGTVVEGLFNAIDWSSGSYYLKVEADINNQGSYAISGTSLIASVPYALFASNANSANALADLGANAGDVLSWDGTKWIPTAGGTGAYQWKESNGNIYANHIGNVGIGTDTPVGKLEVKGTSSDPNVALFEVKDKNGNPIFSVYPNGVEVVFDETAPLRGAKGGFAVSGRNSTRAVVDIVRVTTDSTTVYVNNLAKRGAKGGFAVSGRNSTRLTGNEILRVTPDSTRIYTADPTKGFGVGQMGIGTSDSYLKLLPENYFIGHRSGLNTTGLYNTFIGYTAGLANTTGSSNIFIGYEVGKANTTGSFNTFLGYQVGLSNNASYNSFLGYQAGRSNTSGQYNSFIGYNTGMSNTSGNSNVFIGYQAGLNNNANYNLFVGNEAGYSNSTGTNNTFMGYNAGRLNTSGNSNVFIGNSSGTSNTTGSSNIMIGLDVGRSNTIGNNNILLGQAAGYTGTNLRNNVFIGDSTGFFTNNINASKNIFIGYTAGKNNQSYNNVYIGNQAGYTNVSGQNNIAIGDMAGYSNATSQNIFIGTEAGKNNTTGYFNIIMGRWAGRQITTGYQQIIIGGGAGGSLTTGAENIMMGNNAGAVNDGDKNIFIGNSAGWSNTGSSNIIMGYKVGYSYFQTVSNRLIIDNSQVATPLIWGEFDNRRLVVNGINTDNPSNYTFYVNGTSGGDFAWNSLSDQRLKKYIITIPDALKKVLMLRGVNFEWKDTSNQEKGKRVGFIAQEVEKVVPEVVNYSKENDTYSMQYAPVTALLVEAVKEQQAIIEKQNISQQAQQKQIDELKARIAQLEEMVMKISNK